MTLLDVEEVVGFVGQIHILVRFRTNEFARDLPQIHIDLSVSKIWPYHGVLPKDGANICNHALSFVLVVQIINAVGQNDVGDEVSCWPNSCVLIDL